MSLTLPTTKGANLAGLCERARPALAALGDLGAPLLGVLAAVERAGHDCGSELLADPGFALDVLTEAGPGTDPALVGRVLDFLRSQTGTSPVTGGVSPAHGRPAVTVADAVASYESGALTLLADSTQTGYRTWARRLAQAHGDDDPDEVTAGDLKDLIAHWVTEARLHNPQARRDASSVEYSAVAAFRHLWGYFCDKGWTTENVAKGMRRPSLDDPLRRPFRPEEAAVVRHLARGLGRRDGLLNEATICLSERLGLRRIELNRLRICDLDLTRAELRVNGKGNKFRIMPVPPVLAELLARYVESRRPATIPAEVWRRSDETLLRYRPTERFPQGRPVGPTRIDRLFKALRDAAPDIFVNDDLSQHCYRHSLGTWVDAHYNRAVTRAVLGHKGRRSPTDHYVHVAPETIREAICAYEQQLLAADPSISPEGDSSPGANDEEVTG